VKKQLMFVVLLGVVVLLLATCSLLNAQTGTTGTVLGTVSDPSGAAVAEAPVTLRNRATNSSTTQNTNSAGQYTFVNVVPGDYEISVKQPGFRAVNVPHVTVDVAKSYTVDLKLEVGQVTESVTVTTEARVELQTTDAQVGDVVGGTTLVRLPTLQRDASELLTLQPGTTPYDSGAANGTFGNTGGTVAGARSDQNTVLMDGIDITDNTVGGGPTLPTSFQRASRAWRNSKWAFPTPMPPSTALLVVRSL
jgi:Carboxypeptidase regulatory-like domain